MASEELTVITEFWFGLGDPDIIVPALFVSPNMESTVVHPKRL